MEIENKKNKDKYLLIFSPEVNEQTHFFCCCSIFAGNIFISIIFLIIAIIDFISSLYTLNRQSILKLIKALYYSVCGGFLFYSTYSKKYMYGRITYILYEILFFLRLILYIVAVLVNFFSIFIFLKGAYIIKFFVVLLTAFIELGIMSYFIYIIYCHLVLCSESDNEIMNNEEEKDELLRDYKENEKGTIEIKIK